MRTASWVLRVVTELDYRTCTTHAFKRVGSLPRCGCDASFRKTPGRPELAMLGQQNKPFNDRSSFLTWGFAVAMSTTGDVRSTKQANS
ncbi:MAG: hypothetical protein Q4A92_08325, partial [Corynebacterium sp.]|nr:hypothetical protein [Corynebacterium sp.]